MSKIAFVLGTRPEITKMYGPIKYCVENNVDHIVVNTDQHYDQAMRDVFFEELGLPQPKYQLGIGSASHATMLAKMLIALEEVFLKEKPSVVVVQGDTNTVLAGGLVACKMGIKVAHIEAGLRSYDREMPEEYNRVIVDHCSDFLFAPTEKQADILRKEAIPASDIYVTGNTIVDAVHDISKRSSFDHEGKYLLLTCHRPSNTDNEASLSAILSSIQSICERDDLQCIFPVHPRLGSKLNFIRSYNRIKAVEPLPYTQLLGAMKGAELILTDSGGIQEESCIMQKKCLILRTNTERPETVEVGGAVLLDEITRDELIKRYDELTARQVEWYNPFGDGTSGEQIVKILQEKA